MKYPRTQKLMASFGILTMLLGALLVVAPSAGAEDDPPPPLTSEPDGLYGVYGDQGQNVNLKCADLNDGDAYDYRADDWDDDLALGVLETAGGAHTTGQSGNPLEITWESPVTIDVVIVKQSTVSAVYNVGGVKSGTVEVVLPTSVDASTGGVSHVTFCTGADDNTPPKLTVTKLVNTDDTFTVSVSQDEEQVAQKVLGNDESIVVDDADGAYAVSEELGQDWQDASFDCGEASVSNETRNGFSVTVSGSDVSCTITNTPSTPTPPKLTVKKIVSTDNTFTVTIAQSEQQVEKVLGNNGSIVVDPAEGTYIVSEELPETGWQNPSFDCGAATVTPVSATSSA